MYEWPASGARQFRFTNGDGFSVSAVVAGTERTLTQGDLRLTFYQGLPRAGCLRMEMGAPPG